MAESSLERTFATLWRAVDGPEYVSEYKFHPSRKWRLDAAWPDLLVGVELQGGTWMQGRHSRPEGYTRDCEKANALAYLGWAIFRYTPDMLILDPAGHLDPLLHLVQLRTVLREQELMVVAAATDTSRLTIDPHVWSSASSVSTMTHNPRPAP